MNKIQLLRVYALSNMSVVMAIYRNAGGNADRVRSHLSSYDRLAKTVRTVCRVSHHELEHLLRGAVENGAHDHLCANSDVDLVLHCGKFPA